MSDINLNPTGIYPNYKYTADASSGLTGEGIFIPLTSVPELSATEADHSGGGDGDYRKLLWGLVSAAESHISDLEDKPAKMTVSKSALSFVDDDTAKRSHTFVFNYAVSDLDVEAED